MRKLEIVQSNVEPPKHNLWLTKDESGQPIIKKFGSKGWESLGVSLTSLLNKENPDGTINTLKEVLNFLDGFEDKDVLKEILENSKPVEISGTFAIGKRIPITTNYTYNGLPISHFRISNTGTNDYNIVFCIGHIDAGEEYHNYIEYTTVSDNEFKFVANYTSRKDDADMEYAPSYIRALFGDVVVGEIKFGKKIKQGLMTLEDKQKLDNAATKTEVNAKYTKPSSGIPKTDLASVVQTSLNKADSALQSHQDISHLATKEEIENNEKVTAAALVDLETRKVNIEDIPSIPTKVSELINDSGFITTHQDISGKQDAITDLDTIRSGATKGATSLQTSQRGVANGVASLDSTGKVPSSQLPSYVDDVLEYSTLSNLPSPGETGKIYVTTNDNKSYRWTGTTYIEISKSIIIGETTGTAFDGGKGKELLDDLSVIKQTIEDNEKITSASLVELNKRISNIEQQLNS